MESNPPPGGDPYTQIEPRFGWSNLFLTPEKDPRSWSPSVGERATLRDSLTGYRQTLELKCQGLDPEQLARRSVPPSNLSLLGLLRHMTEVECQWFRKVLSGEDGPGRYSSPAEPDAAFVGAAPDPGVIAEAWAAWREEVNYAERCVDALSDLGASVPRSDGAEGSVREVLVHMIEEYARHCGHADLIRERIDGRVGA